MFRRVALQHQARRPPWLLALKIAQAHAATRTEGRRIVEDLSDLGVPRDRVGAVLFEPDNWPRLPQRFVRRMRIAQKIERERIERRRRNPSGRPRGRGLRHCSVSSKEPVASDAIIERAALAIRPAREPSSQARSLESRFGPAPQSPREAQGRWRVNARRSHRAAFDAPISRRSNLTQPRALTALTPGR